MGQAERAGRVPPPPPRPPNPTCSRCKASGGSHPASAPPPPGSPGRSPWSRRRSPWQAPPPSPCARTAWRGRRRSCATRRGWRSTSCGAGRSSSASWCRTPPGGWRTWCWGLMTRRPTRWAAPHQGARGAAAPAPRPSRRARRHPPRAVAPPAAGRDLALHGRSGGARGQPHRQRAVPAGGQDLQAGGQQRAQLLARWAAGGKGAMACERGAAIAQDFLARMQGVATGEAAPSAHTRRPAQAARWATTRWSGRRSAPTPARASACA